MKQQFKNTILTMLLAVFSMAALAQMQDPVHFTVIQKQEIGRASCRERV